MASSKTYLEFVLDQLSDAGDITLRKMMGEYLLYCDGILFGGIYDDRLLMKPVQVARRLMPETREELPYEGAKPMLLVENLDDRAFLAQLVRATLPELPAKKQH